MPDYQLRKLSWAARALNVDRSTIYQRAQRGEIPGLLRIGHMWRIHEPTFWAGLGLPMPEDNDEETETA